MDAETIIDRMERFAPVLSALVDGLPDADVRWKPVSGAWSICEVVHHLADEEVEDFRRRLELTLTDPARDWPPIDPEGWAIERDYNGGGPGGGGDPAEALARFITERRRSVAWLRSLGETDWSSSHVHPRLGPMPAGVLLASWAAHDALHLRQIAKRMFELTRRDAGGYDTAYAGQWDPKSH